MLISCKNQADKRLQNKKPSAINNKIRIGPTESHKHSSYSEYQLLTPCYTPVDSQPNTYRSTLRQQQAPKFVTRILPFSSKVICCSPLPETKFNPGLGLLALYAYLKKQIPVVFSSAEPLAGYVAEPELVVPASSNRSDSRSPINIVRHVACSYST